MDSDEYYRMQESAEQRVRNMNRRAQSYTAHHGQPPQQSRGTEAPPPERERQEPPKPKPPEKRGAQLLKMLNLKGIDLDTDRALIIGMMLLLLSESDDEYLIFALLYIML